MWTQTNSTQHIYDMNQPNTVMTHQSIQPRQISLVERTDLWLFLFLLFFPTNVELRHHMYASMFNVLIVNDKW